MYKILSFSFKFHSVLVDLVMAAIVKSTAFLVMLVTSMALHSETELKISAFNIQIFGVSKMEDQFVVDLLIQVSR